MSKVDQFIDELPPQFKEKAIVVRQMLLDAHPMMKESFKYGVPYYEFFGPVCYLSVQKGQFLMGFTKGALLATNNEFLVGDQKVVRHLMIDSLDVEKLEIINQTIQDALELNQSVNG